MRIIGRVWKFGDEINTDLIMPHQALRVSPEEQCRFCMSDNRPGWSSLVKPGDIIIGGSNFGTGSSRPASIILRRMGLAGMAADSMNGLFFRNCVSYGFAAISVEGVSGMFEEGDIAEIDYAEGYVKNTRTGEIRYGNKMSKEMLEMIAAGGIEGVLEAKGYFDKNR